MQVILTNGMPRSGSTWLYNALRHILSEVTPKNIFLYGWHEDIKERRQVNLIKAHGINQTLLQEATQIFYSYRDIRDVLASRKRMWGMDPTMEVARSLFVECEFFEKASNYVMRYEDFIANPMAILKDLVRYFDADELDIEAIQVMLQAEKKPASDGKPYNKEELYHRGHVTNGQHMTFQGVVSDKLIEQIEDSFGSWFIDHGYPLITR